MSEVQHHAARLVEKHGRAKALELCEKWVEDPTWNGYWKEVIAEILQ